MNPKPSERNNLRRLIKEKYGSIIAFGYTVGVSDALVSKVQNGWVDIPESRKKEWARALSCRVADIFSETSD
jgi:hypothetical protein